MAEAIASFRAIRSPIAVAIARKFNDPQMELGEMQLSAGAPGLAAELPKGCQDVEIETS